MLIALLFAASVTAAPHVDRIAETGRVWAAARYYHPYSMTRDLDWDAMLVDALKEVQSAESDEQEMAAIRAMLARIGDPVTTVRRPPLAAPPGTLLLLMLTRLTRMMHQDRERLCVVV